MGSGSAPCWDVHCPIGSCGRVMSEFNESQRNSKGIPSWVDAIIMTKNREIVSMSVGLMNAFCSRKLTGSFNGLRVGCGQQTRVLLLSLK